MNNKSVKKNTIYNTLKSVAAVIFPLITFPYISRVLGAENVGKLNFANSIVSYFSLIAGLGISTYAARECAKVRDNKARLSDVASQLFSINIVTTIISFALLFILLLIAIPLRNYTLLILIQSISILFTTLGADWLNTAMEDFKFISLRTVAFQLLSLALMFIFVRNADDYIIYAVISVIANSGACISNMFYRKKYCNVRLTSDLCFKKHFSSIIAFFSMTIAQIVYFNSDITILGLIRTDVEVGEYSIASKIFYLLNFVICSIVFVVLPQLSISFERKDYESVNNILTNAFDFITVIGLPCVVGVFILADEAVLLFAGEEYAKSIIPLRILAIALFISLFTSFIGNTILLPSGKEKVFLKAEVISTICNVVANLIFIPYWGINAAAVTTVGAELISFIICLLNVDTKIHINNGIKRIIGPVVGSVLIAIYGMFIKYFSLGTINTTIVTILGSVIIYGIVLVLTKNEFFFEYYKSARKRFIKK